MEKQILRHAKTKGGRFEKKLYANLDGTFTIVEFTKGEPGHTRAGIPEEDIAYQLFNLDCAMAREIDGITYEEVFSC